MTMPRKHKGQVVERVLRQSGYTITKIAKQLRISRNTLYNKFNNPNLSFEFIRKLGEIVSYDFSLEFPEIKQEVGESNEAVHPYLERRNAEFSGFAREYFVLSKQYQSLLEFLIKLANENELATIKKEISRFVEASDWAALHKDSRGSSTAPTSEHS